MSQRPSFEIGLVMAGAISAGAYTAGVVDFLIEALDEYDSAKRRPDWDGPTHDVFLPVIAGASAGGMTAGISALELFRELDHVWPERPEPRPERNRLYSSWVKDISIERLLETSDLRGGRGKQGVVSALCCDVLDEIVARAFEVTSTAIQRPWVGGPGGVPLKLLLTISNLRGVPYAFDLLGGSEARYGMLNHGDYLEFDVAQGASGGSGLDPTDLAKAPAQFKAACLATGAFPIGLAPRALKQRFGDYKTGERVVYTDSNGNFHCVPPASLVADDTEYAFTAVDGGLIDNEPFELARRTLSGGANVHNPPDGDKARKAVLLVDPFPNVPVLPPPGSDRRLVSTVKALLPTLIDQARFKPDELGPALNDRVYSRFVIAPVSEIGGSKLPIACGSLGGFGGFLHESFRRHDYLLGRRNAQAFLRWHFALPETNPLFSKFDVGRRAGWYVKEPNKQSGSISQKADRTLSTKPFAATVVPAGQEEKGLPIIPLTKKMLEPIELKPTDRPKPKSVNTDTLRGLIDERAKVVLSTIVDQDLKDLLSAWKPFDFVLRKGAVAYGRRIVTTAAIQHIERALADVSSSFG
ncbi:MAG TPA: patatin [Casimicrobiaceae bacterium]|nr:patatin [Casimicrobiaceae bacterium]